MLRHATAVSLLILAAVPAMAQKDLLDQLAGLVNRGKVNVEVDLQPGSATITPEWTLQTAGAPKATLIVEADEGRVRCVDVDVSGGTLVISGKGLRPALQLEGMRFEEGTGIIDARFRGRGVWRPIIAVFRTLAKPALRHIAVPTDIQSILRGDILASKQSTSEASPDFLKLVRVVHIGNTEFEAFSGYPLAFGELIDFDTRSLRVAIDKGTFTPPAQFEVDGRIDGDIENGAAAFLGNHGRFSRGELRRGTFRVSDNQTSFSAGAFALDLTYGQFHWPGGPKIGVEAPSRFEVRDLRVRPDGSYSGIVDAALFGKVGSVDRAGTRIAANDVQLHTHGAKIVNGKATGDIKLNFQYRLNHTLVVHYPVEELRDRRVPLLFQGLFDADLHFENAGSGDEGVVTGTYQFTIPWPPVEQAAFEVLRARWQQDVAPAIHKVKFAIEPRRFGPCGHDCFLLDVKMTAEKTKRFQQICNTEGKADVVVDAPTRSLVLRNLRLQPRCEGLLGAIVNFVAPFLTKSYSDIALMQMPADLPFTIDSVGSAADSIFIAGKVDWATASNVAPALSRR
ncbi:MAG: hypothetical protein DMF58_14410 [Acidobacteria bacterium]|nr:MAG: hypothetical protein DMF58_14410 [Acidobacteriota bacterium]